MDSQDTSQAESQLDSLEQKACQPDCNSNCEDSNIAISTDGSVELHSSSDSQPVSTGSLIGSCIDVTEPDNVNPAVTPVPELSLQNVASGQEGNELDLPSTVITTSVTSDNCNEGNTDSDLAMDVSSSEVAVLGSGIPESSSRCSGVSSTCSEAEKIDACVDISHEVQQSDLGTSSDTEKLDCGGAQLQQHSVCPQADEPMNGINEGSNDNMKNSIDAGSVSQLPLECLETNKGHSNDNCNEDNTDSDLVMDVSSSEVAVLGSGIPESSSRCGVSSTCSEAEKTDACVDINHEVQQSDLGTSSDTEKLDCGGAQLQLHSVCPQADELMNGINEGSNDNMKNSIDAGSVSQLPSECLETNKGHCNVTNDSGKIVGSIDDCSVPQPPSECLENNKEHNNVMNDNDDGEIKSSENSGVSVENNIKQEPYDAEYERSDLIYRSGHIVVDSDDDTDSSMFSNTEAAHSDNDAVSEEEPVEKMNAVRVPVPQRRVRTEGEVFPEELPPIEYLTISPDEDVVLEALGTVSGIVGVLVIVKANLNSPALFDDTVLFLDGRQPLGLIFEIFGTVEQTYYSVRFNTKQDIEDRGIAAGDKVFFAPKADNLTKYVFIAELRKIKCDDASWENDNEPPPAHVEYSDDEAERKARQLQRNKNRGVEETSETPVRRKKQRKKPNSSYERDPHGPQLLPGDLNRNPFGNKNQTFSSSTKPHWPHAEGNRQSPNHGPRFSPRVAPQPPPTSYGAFRNQWPPGGPFAERSGWNQQPGILGNIPNAAMTRSPDMGGSFTNNTFGSHQLRQPRPGFGIASFPPPPPGHSTHGPGFGITSFPPPPPGHSTHGPSSYQPQNCMPPQTNGSEMYFPRGNMEHMNTFALPPPPATPPPPFPASQHQMHRPPGFPMFCPSQPPPVVNAMFNQHRPPTPHLPTRR